MKVEDQKKEKELTGFYVGGTVAEGRNPLDLLSWGP